MCLHKNPFLRVVRNLPLSTIPKRGSSIEDATCVWSRSNHGSEATAAIHNMKFCTTENRLVVKVTHFLSEHLLAPRRSVDLQCSSTGVSTSRWTISGPFDMLPCKTPRSARATKMDIKRNCIPEAIASAATALTDERDQDPHRKQGRTAQMGERDDVKHDRTDASNLRSVQELHIYVVRVLAQKPACQSKIQITKSLFFTL